MWHNKTWIPGDITMHSIKWVYSIFLILFISVSTYADILSSKDKFPPTLTLGGQEWKLDNNQENKDLQLAEYVTHGENVNHWTELFTIQRFKFSLPKTITPLMFAEKEISQMKEKGYQPIFTVISSSPHEAMIEFRIETPKTEQQDELQRIIDLSNDNNFLVIHYVIKISDMGVAARNKWIQILKNLK